MRNKNIVVNLFIVCGLVGCSVFAQTRIRDLPLKSPVVAGDYFPVDAGSGGTWKTTLADILSGVVVNSRIINCTAPLLCNGSSSMDLSGTRTLSISLSSLTLDPRNQYVNCAGVNDTTAIDAAVTAIQSYSGTSGGILHLSGSCIYSGAGIVNNPAAGTTRHLIIEGDGPSSTVLTFSACSNSQCILLGSQSGVGSGRADGSGIRDITIVAPVAKDAITVANLENWSIHDLYVYAGATALTVSESRFGRVTNSTFRNHTVNGIKIIGESFAANYFDDITINTSTATGSGFTYTKTGTTDAGGININSVKINGNYTGSGFLFSNSTINSMFVFADSSIADGNFSADAWKFVKAGNVDMVNCFGVNQAAGTNSSTLTLDDVQDASIIGGEFYANTGATGSDLSLKNSVARTMISKTRFTGPVLAVRVDGTTHDVDLSGSFFASSSFTNDQSKIVPSSSVMYATPSTLITGSTKPSMLGLIDPAGSLAQYIDVDSSGNLKLFASNGSTTLETLTQAGNVTFTGTVAGSNLSGSSSGTNTGDQTITLTGDVTGSGTGSFAATLNTTYKGWTDAGTTINTTASTDKVGIGTSAPDSPLTVTTNTTTLPANLTGTQIHLAGADSAGSLILNETFAGVPSFACRRANGTNAVPTAIGVNDLLCNFAGYGYGTSYGATPGAAFRFYADQAWTGTAQGTRIEFQTDDLNTTTPTTKWTISAMGHLKHTQTTAPTVACTGTGTSPAAPTIDSGGTDHKFTVTINTGTGTPGSTGTCTVTFATAFSAVRPIVCMLVKGASNWGNGATIQETTESASAPVFTWTNLVGGVATGLTTSGSYKFSCLTIE